MDSILQLWEILRHLQDHIGDLLQAWGAWFYALIFLVIFCETGLVVTPFLPGDSLLFAVGAVAARSPSLDMTILIVLLTTAAVVGDAVNYAIGYRLGPKVFKYEQSWFFNKKHLLRAQAFYEKYGSKTILLARFVPIVRTFAPFVAGIGKMSYRRFVVYNFAGGLAWVLICLWSGYFFGQWPVVKNNFEMVVLGIIVVSVLPMVVEFVLAWHKKATLEQMAAQPPQPLAQPGDERRVESRQAS
jgi:membrane-associated protein